MFGLNMEEVYSGYSNEVFNNVRDALENENIKYDYKVVDHMGQWTGRGTMRGNFGSAGARPGYEKQYIVKVKKTDYPLAGQIVGRLNHQ